MNDKAVCRTALATSGLSIIQVQGRIDTCNIIITMLNSIRSEIMDPLNRNTENSNLPKVKIQALKELIRLQKERIIIIKAADKGAGIVILNFKD